MPKMCMMLFARALACAVPCAFAPMLTFAFVGNLYGACATYGAYMTFVDARPAGSVQKCTKWRSAGGKDYFSQWTHPDWRLSGMVWTTGSTRRVKVVFSSPKMDFFGLFGARVRPVHEGNACTLNISASSVCFTGGEMMVMA